MNSVHTGAVFFFSSLLMFLGATGCEPQEQKKVPVARDTDSKQQSADITAVMEGARLLDDAIDAQMGLDGIKAALQWSARSSGTYLGMPYSGITTFAGESMRMDIQAPGGEMSFVMGGKYCWSKTGPVVTPCSDAERKAYKEQFFWQEAARLYPLKQEGWVVKKSTTRTGDKDYPTLLISHRGHEGEARLVFDPKSMLLVSSRLPMVFNGQKGQMLTEMLDYRKQCGALLPFHTISTFEGKKVMEDRIDEYYCGPVREDLFPQPLQVADGTFLQYTTDAKTAFCTSVHGVVADTGQATDKLMKEVAAKKWVPMGPLFLVHLLAPDLASKERQAEALLCVPVSVPPPEKPQVSGDYVLKVFPPTKVLAVFGVGDYAAQFDRLSKRLNEELKTRKLKKSGPVIQIFHHDPSHVPTKKLVTELQAQVK